MIYAFLSGFNAGLLVSLLIYLYGRRARKPKPPPPHPLTALFDHLKKQGIPFEVIQGDPTVCPCPKCVARREQEKTHTRGENDALH